MTLKVRIERQTPERKLSAFRETVSVVVVSVVVELVVLGAFAIVRIFWPDYTPDVGELVRNRDAYFDKNYASIVAWAVGLLVFAVALAYLVTLPRLRKILRIDQQHPSRLSAWWFAFEGWYPEHRKHIGCVLDDGSYIEGMLGSYNNAADDLPDRDLILFPPIKYRAPDSDAAPEEMSVGSVCVSARRIMTLSTSYLPPTFSSPSEEVEVEERTALEASRLGSLIGLSVLLVAFVPFVLRKLVRVARSLFSLFRSFFPR